MSAPVDAIDPDIVTEATRRDLVLAIEAVGFRAQYGGLLACALAGIYAERERGRSESVAIEEAFVEAVLNEPLPDDVFPFVVQVRDVVAVAKWLAPVAAKITSPAAAT